MKDGNLRLRLLRISDGPFILRGLNDEAILKASGLSGPIASAWFFVWWWMRKTFTPAYCIEYLSKQIGFIGLYNLMIGKSAEMALIIFDKNNRRLGYGTQAFNICAQGLQRHSLVTEILVNVNADNHAALSFWRKLGFVEVHISNALITMSMGL
jgi:ribosomal protein S18 acetylase RimI-like enzyme